MSSASSSYIKGRLDAYNQAIPYVKCVLAERPQLPDVDIVFPIAVEHVSEGNFSIIARRELRRGGSMVKTLIDERSLSVLLGPDRKVKCWVQHTLTVDGEIRGSGIHMAHYTDEGISLYEPVVNRRGVVALRLVEGEPKSNASQLWNDFSLMFTTIEGINVPDGDLMRDLYSRI